ncbi:MAG: tubulin/FtsZ family protein [Chloroflexota bacterium]
MKLIVIGLGQCGGRIADEFAKLREAAHAQRKINIVPGVYAANTDAADLSGLTAIPRDYRHRILIGNRKTGGHGVGKINELGAEIAKDDGDKIVDAINATRGLFEADAFLLIASAAGGTGSGSLPIITKMVKDRYIDKPVYNMVVLPFEHEEKTEERTIYNSATCLKSVNSVADAVFLVDNQRYVRKDASLRSNMAKINRLMAEPFYDLLCAGEEKKPKHIGAKVLDAGDIIQTLVGWTVIGYGKTPLPVFKLPFQQTRDFIKKSAETQKGVQTMDEAMMELSLKCNPADAARALYLISGPGKELNMDLVKELGDYLRGLAPQAVIRSGDYPREKGAVEVIVILSELSEVEKVRNYYRESTVFLSERGKKQESIETRLRGIDEAAKDIPTLF